VQVASDDLALMRRVLVAMAITGGLTSGLGVPTQTTSLARLEVGFFGAGFIALGLLLVALRPRRWLLEAMAMLSILFVSAVLATAHPINVAPLYFSWPATFIAYFCSRRLLAWSLLWIAVTAAIGLALSYAPGNLKIPLFVGILGSVGPTSVLVSRLRDRESRLRSSLAAAADTDALTGLLNRRAFAPRLSQLMAQARFQEQPVSVAMFDLDHFKRLNDEHGHLAGDDALRRVAEILTRASRVGDLASRFGGEEFAVALYGADLEAARSYAERVARALAADDLVPGVRITVSAGLTCLDSADRGLDPLLSRADAALYAAKEAGRARTGFWRNGALEIDAPLLAPAAVPS